MGCGSSGGCSSGGCSSGGGGCSSGGGCSTGGCNKLNTFDWMSDYLLPDEYPTKNIVEVSFKNGVRKGFYINNENLPIENGTMVAVQSAIGHDVGQVVLSGLLAELQLKKKKAEKEEIPKIYRLATKNDISKLEEAREKDMSTLIKSRFLAKELGLEMKIGEVEYQADSKKVTFYYTAEGRVDFRELVRVFAREFKTKVEMKQIGLRQEAAKIGGIGSCGRELCCSTWLSDFKVVSTQAARYQNLAINTTKLSGQCGRLKCCLNFELDLYMEAVKEFPKNINTITTKRGPAKLIKTDILKKALFYTYKESPTLYEVELDEVYDKLDEIKNGITPDDFTIGNVVEEENEKDTDLVGHISISQLEKKKKKKRPNKNRNNKKKGPVNENQNKPLNKKPNQPNKKKPNNKNKPEKKKDNNPQNTVKDGSNPPKKNNRNNKNKKFNKDKPKPTKPE
jgi:cell fate regulator YaaT (PSP1 superfamily)